MKGKRLVLVAIFCFLATISSDAEDRREDADLHAVVATVGQILEQAHFSQKKLDAAMGKQVLEVYLESLDLNKLFFTQEDIDRIRNAYSSGLNDDILLGNFTPAKNIFAIFRHRVDERVARIDGLLKERYGFSSDRTIISNRAKEPWPTSASEADGIWRDWIENELLTAKLTTTSAESVPGVIERHYRELQSRIDRQDDEDVLRIFLEAVAQTYDPHSEYLGPSDLNQFKIDTELTISGIGVEIRMKDGYATVERIFAGGPADHSRKLHVGDKIVGVAEGNGPFVNILQSNLDKITAMVLGKNGSVVRLQFITSDTKNRSTRRVVSLVRKDIRLTEEQAQAELVEMHLPGGVQKLGWVSVPSFYGDPENSGSDTGVTHDVATLLSRLKREGIQGLVIDLRNNGGGSVDEAVRLAGLFINQGPIVQLKDPTSEIHVVKEQTGKALYEGPMVVLDNKLTASASEIFSAAMQDYRRAAIVGDSSTFGKGTVQAVVELNRYIDRIGDLPDVAGALKVTIEKVFRVTGESTQLKGVISDLKIPSLTETAVLGENEQEHRLGYDEVTPAPIEGARNRNPLFLDELRRRSSARIKENPLFQDLAKEVALLNESTEKNRVSLNEKVRENELAEITQLRDKEDSDRKTALAQDRNKYYQLTLADVARPELSLIKIGSDPDASAQTASPDNAPQSFQGSPSGALGTGTFDALSENQAITRETLNILSDLVNLARARQTVIGGLEKRVGSY
jgi:carboxyl-terminal processing protease